MRARGRAVAPLLTFALGWTLAGWLEWLGASMWVDLFVLVAASALILAVA